MAALQRIGLISRVKDRLLTGKIGGPIAVARRGGHADGEALRRECCRSCTEA